MPYGATIVITVTHPRFSLDSVALAKVQAVDLSQEFTFPGIGLTICYDNTTVSAPGQIRREVRVPFTADFMAAHVGAAAETRAIENILNAKFTMAVPAYGVTWTTTLGNVACP